MLISTLALSLSLACPDYGQTMSNEFFMAAPTCNWLECADPTLKKLHAYTKAMRERADRQKDPCIRAAIIDYANWLDKDGESDRARRAEFNRAEDERRKIAK